MQTYSSAYLMFCSFVGFAGFMVFSWIEWRKTVQPTISFKQYIVEDQPGFISAVLLAVASYIALPELAQIAYLRDKLGFAPNKTPLGAMGGSFIFGVLGYQWRAIFGKGKEQLSSG